MRMVLAGLMLSAVAPPPAAETGEQALARVIGERQAAAPVDCIDPHLIGSTRIIAGTAIVYGIGDRLYVNRPASGAARLREDDVLVEPVEGGTLCRIDSVTLVDPVARMTRGFVILGPFAVYAPEHGKRPAR